MLRRLGQAYLRFVGVAMAVLGVWALAINLIEDSFSGGARAWILASAALGAAGGLTFVLSFDGPDRLRTRWFRLSGWVGMLVLAVLPWSFTFLVLPMVLLTVPTLFVLPDKGSQEVTRDGNVFTLIRDANETRVLKDLGDGVRVEVVSSSVDQETLLRIAEDISRDKNPSH